MKKKLRTGYTTGACAAAGAKAAVMMLEQQSTISQITIQLPSGIPATFALHGQSWSSDTAACYIIKDAGDDPDITNGAEIHVQARQTAAESADAPSLIIAGGAGIGTVTKPGLAIAPGEWAINPVPRRMIAEAVASVSVRQDNRHHTTTIVISIPDGEERAKKTLNGRLGIIGGLSILGTSGIVRPISTAAWTDTIDASLDVAKACGCETVILSTGRTSEQAARLALPHLPEEACIMMGDHVGYAVRACLARGFTAPVIACQFAKMLKIACGHENTHATASDLDLGTLFTWVEAAKLPRHFLDLISHANTAREIAIATDFDTTLMEIVSARAQRAAAVHAPGITIIPMLCRYDVSTRQPPPFFPATSEH